MMHDQQKTAQLERISIKLNYTTTSGGRIEWDAATHRRDDRAEWRDTSGADHATDTSPLTKSSRCTVQKSEPTRVIEQTLEQLAIAAAVHGIPEERMLEVISLAYARVRK